MLTRLRRLAALAAVALLMFAGANVLAQTAATEASLKAAFLYKFPGYVEWPAAAFATADAPLVIGVSGADDVATELERLVPGRNINGHPVVVRRVREDSLRGVHVLFVGRGDPAARAAVDGGRQQGALVVTETERGLELGSAINFVPLNERIAFDVSLPNAERAGLRISARMLAVARRVVPKA
jgi:hypothetical protein